MILVDFIGECAVSTDSVKISVIVNDGCFCVAASNLIFYTDRDIVDEIQLSRLYDEKRDAGRDFNDMLNHLEQGDKIYYFR